MDQSGKVCEAPRHRMVSARISPMVELARWLFELQNIPYAEEPHAPALHIIFTRLAHGGLEIPVIVSAEGVWDGGPAVVAELAKKSPPHARLISDDPATGADQRALITFLFAHLLKQVRRFVYHRLLPNKAMIAPVVTADAPFLERAFVYCFYGLWRKLMAIGLGFAPELLAQAPKDIEAAFAEVERRLSDGRRFLGGDAPGTMDIVFSALAAPVIFPDQYGARLPRLEDLPADLQSYVNAMRARRAGQLVLEVYRQARGTPQPRLTLGTNSASSPPAALLRLGANALRGICPNLAIGSLRFVSTWAGVKEALDNDAVFHIGPINARRIREVSGDFILGMDRSEQLTRERSALYAAFEEVDTARIRRVIDTESTRLLDAAASGLGRIDVVNGYGRLVAARAAVALLGVGGPSEPDLMRVIRAVFSHTFLNLSNDENVRQTAVAAGAELASWIDAEITRRRTAGLTYRGDFLGAMMAQAPQTGLSDDDIRRNVAGMMVGAIDTTATCVANIVAEIGGNPALVPDLMADLYNSERFAGWCWDLLRRRPHNPLVLRKCAAPSTLASKPVAADKTVVVFTLAAMHDPAAFRDPDRMDPGRPRDRYLHFGGGIHECAGRAINAFQIPMLVAALMRQRPTHFGPLRLRGPFPDQLVVDLSPGAD